jgi:hypothetical protein
MFVETTFIAVPHHMRSPPATNFDDPRHPLP